MGHRVCPWWIGYFLASPIRRWLTKPEKIVAPYVRPGNTVLEPGPGMGFFTLSMAQMVGESGRVIAVDLQPRMLDRLKRRAAQAQLGNRIDARLCSADSLGIEDLSGKVDFTLAFAMVHELPDGHPFFSEIAKASKTGARLLISEPGGHVKPEKFQAEIQQAQAAGFEVVEEPGIKGKLTVLLRKG